MHKTKMVIVSCPYTEPRPAIAPVVLSACLNAAGYDARGYDLSIEFHDRFIDEPYWAELKNWLAIGIVPKSGINRRMLIEVLKFIRRQLLHLKKEYDPEYFGVSVFTNESINFAQILLPYIRRYLPQSKIVVGGRGLELTCGVENRPHYEKFWDYGLADVVVIGDAEQSVIDVVKNDVRGIYHSPLATAEDMSRVPVPRWSDYDIRRYPAQKEERRDRANYFGEDYITVTGSKGCVRNCTFCDVNSFWPKYVFRPGDQIANEIITSFRNTGVRYFRFTDNLMNGSIKHYNLMNEVLAREIPGEINYHGYAIFRGRTQMPEEHFEMAARAGCARWSIGIESGSERVRFDTRKKVTNDDTEWGISMLDKYGIRQNHLIMVGYPSETEEDFQETVRYLKRYAGLGQVGSIKLNLTLFQINQNTPLMMDAREVDKYKINYNPTDVSSRWFWTVDSNPDNTFSVRVDRWRRLMKVAVDYGYTFTEDTPVSKFYDEINDLEQQYNDKSKIPKVFPIYQK